MDMPGTERESTFRQIHLAARGLPALERALGAGGRWQQERSGWPEAFGAPLGVAAKSGGEPSGPTRCLRANSARGPRLFPLGSVSPDSTHDRRTRSFAGAVTSSVRAASPESRGRPRLHFVLSLSKGSGRADGCVNLESIRGRRSQGMETASGVALRSRLEIRAPTPRQPNCESGNPERSAEGAKSRGPRLRADRSSPLETERLFCGAS